MNLTEQGTLLVHKHKIETTTLRDEVNRLNIIINIIDAWMMKDNLKEAINMDSIDESEICKSAGSEAAEDYPKPGFSCVECDYRCEKKILYIKFSFLGYHFQS